MKNISRKTRISIKIASATVTAIFSLASVFAGTYAWFASNQSVEATGMSVSIEVTGSAEMKSLNLIKFDYKFDTIGGMQVYDYLDPGTGSVNEYYYNENYNDGEGAFGHDANEEFVRVDAEMNIYDPVDRIIRGGDLSSLNCNAIYEATFTSTITNARLQLFANRLLDKEAGENQILLSDCVDFNVYYETDLEFDDDTYSETATYGIGEFAIYNGYLYCCKTAIESGEAFDSEKWNQITLYSNASTYAVNSYIIYGTAVYKCTTAVASSEGFTKNKWELVNTYSETAAYSLDSVVLYKGQPYKCCTAINSGESFNKNKWDAILCEKIYYPSYRTSLTELEELYYKISYISTHEKTHSNFYSSNPKPNTINIDNHALAFADSETEQRIFVNVNYAPSQTDVYVREIYNTIQALYDYTFDFQFSSNSGVGA